MWGAFFIFKANYYNYVGTWTQYDTVIYPQYPLFESEGVEVENEDDLWSPAESDVSVRIKSLNVHLAQFADELINGNIFQNGESQALPTICREIMNIYHQIYNQNVELHNTWNGSRRFEVSRKKLEEVFLIIQSMYNRIIMIFLHAGNVSVARQYIVESNANENSKRAG